MGGNHHYTADTDWERLRGTTEDGIERPLELLSVSGAIADGEAHLHVVVSCKREEVFGGHLEHGSEVAYLAEIAILKCDDLEITRKLDEERRVKLLASR